MPLIRAYRGVSPRIPASVFLAEDATVIGDVEFGEDANVWYKVVIRGDVGWVRIGARSNIQDLTVVHMTLGRSNTEIGEDVSVGHNAILHGARIEDGVLVGMGAILLDGVVVGRESVIGAGALVPPNSVIPPRSLVLGHPGRVVRELRDDEWTQGRDIAARYVGYAADHRQALSG